MIEHVSDTALWVAAYRAEESARPDALFRDPLAAALAGERGRAIAASMPSARRLSFAMTIRTVAIDRLIESAISQGVDAVLNLGAGLDTRPYRMALPPALRWIEADFPALLEYKSATIGNATPACRVERIPADLTQDSERDRVLARLGSECRRAAVLTEGVVAYLTNDQASTLSRAMIAAPSIEFWIQDYRRGKLNRRAESRLGAPFRFDVMDPLEFFGRDGWRVRENLRILEESDRVGRRVPLPFPWNLLRAVMPKTIRKKGNETYGYVMLEKAR